MSLRRFLAVIALLGVLVHAAAIARHNAIMLAGSLDAAGKSTALAAVGISVNDAAGLICRPADAPEDGSGAPGGPGKSSFCPICLGTAPAHAVLASHDIAPAQLSFVPVERVAFRDMRAGQLKLYRPPARGPPLLLS
jgi:hypothetical protein